jgi:ribonuclease BN (tRNA processing enzyme)
MNLYVLGCHGGETPKHKTSAFVVDGKLGLDAGAITSGLTLKDQYELKGILVSHAHLDHIRDLATLADNRCQAACEPLLVGGTKQTIGVLKKHFFNNKLWPDFGAIPSVENPTIRWVVLPFEKTIEFIGYQVRAIQVSHTIEAAAMVVTTPTGTIAYSGDTGPTDRLWEVLKAEENVRALIMEVSFPNSEQHMASISGHHTPQSLEKDMQKFGKPEDLATFLFHIKPKYQSEVEIECAKLSKLNLDVLKLHDLFEL